MNLQKVLGILTPYSITTSLLYLFGYWGSFDVNILDYIALSDVVKAALYPLLYSSILVIVVIIVGNMLTMPLEKHMPAGAGKNLPEAKYFRFLLWFFNLVFSAVILYTIFFVAGLSRWFSIAAFSMLFIPSIIGDAHFASDFIGHRKTRVIVLNIMMGVLVYSFGWGAINAKGVKEDTKTVIINETTYQVGVIGWAGDYLFLWEDVSKSVHALNKSSVSEFLFSVQPDKPIFTFSDEL
ncbi:hypothetical protein ACPV5O_14515 [Vibrio maritimus]|uniref:hypothetical protein n=1 Tax=Vibrio maritimus TaxID=990268 RepID=UPI004067610C